MPFDLPLKCVLSASCWPLFSAAVIRAAALSLSRQGLNLLTLHKSHVRNIMVLNQFSQQRALSRFFFFGPAMVGVSVPAIRLVNSTISSFPFHIPSYRRTKMAVTYCSRLLNGFLYFLVGCNLHRVSWGYFSRVGAEVYMQLSSRNVLVFLFYPLRACLILALTLILEVPRFG